MVRPTRLLWLLVGVLLVPVLPSIAGADFKCEEHAFDLSVCADPKNVDTCPQVCSSPPDPEMCATLPLPELPSTQRQTAAQPILRQVSVQEGPFLGLALTLSAFSAADDNVFSLGRNLLCVPATTTPPPPGDDGGGSSGGGGTVGSGGGLIGGTPGLIGGNPGLIGGNPGLIGGSSGVR
jgi:hypothetical protein